MVTTPMGRYSTFIRFLIAFFLLVLLIIIGTLGYRFIEGWSIRDSLYMTFITMTTVGFGEVKPLSSAGQHFTIVFLVLSIGTVGYSVTVLITYVFEGQILNVMRERRMKRTIRHLKNHFIIIGGGDVGREAAYAFGRSKKRFVVVDRDPSQSDLSRDESILFIEGDAINDEILVEAGIERASGLIPPFPMTRPMSSWCSPPGNSIPACSSTKPSKRRGSASTPGRSSWASMPRRGGCGSTHRQPRPCPQ